MTRDKLEITPVEKIGAYYFKRDDLFVPFDFSSANGSKMRQGLLLCEKNITLARNGIFTGTSIHSPQAVITATIAKALGVNCVIVYGGTTEEACKKNRYYRICKALGADVKFCKVGYTAFVTKKAKELADICGGFNIRYGFDLKSNIEVFIESVANQVKNIPEELDYLVITIGSAITVTGVLLGIAKFNKKVGAVIGVGCAPNRLQKIKDYARIIEEQTGYRIPLEILRYYDCFNRLKGYKYENTMHAAYYGLEFHPRYEAKTFTFMRNNIPQHSRVLMWVTGRDL